MCGNSRGSNYVESGHATTILSESWNKLVLNSNSQRSGIVDPYSFLDQVTRVRSQLRAARSGRLAP